MFTENTEVRPEIIAEGAIDSIRRHISNPYPSEHICAWFEGRASAARSIKATVETHSAANECSFLMAYAYRHRLFK